MQGTRKAREVKIVAGGKGEERRTRMVHFIFTFWESQPNDEWNSEGHNELIIRNISGRILIS